MAAVFEKTFIQDLTGRLIIRYCPEIVFSKDNLSNQINVKLYVGPNEYAGGGTVTATVIRSDGNTVPVSGSISGNVASVTLIEPCMDVPGQMQVFIRLTSGNVKTTIFAGVFTASRTETDTIIDPGTIIPSITELINQIDAAIDSIPADYSTLLGSVAGTYSTSKTYAVGDYVWYDGALYRCTTAISTAESWTAAHWSRAVLGDDVTSLKSAIGELDDLTTTDKDSVVDAINEVKNSLDTLGSETVKSVNSTTPDNNGNVNIDVSEYVSGAVNDWLDDHPEATTTVEDGAITSVKLSDALRLATVNGYVTPEMFGAKGDGVTDDTLAIKAMLASGAKNIWFDKAQYAVSDSIDITADYSTIRFDNTEITVIYTAGAEKIPYVIGIKAAMITTIGTLRVSAARKALICVWLGGAHGSVIDGLIVSGGLIWGLYLENTGNNNSITINTFRAMSCGLTIAAKGKYQSSTILALSDIDYSRYSYLTASDKDAIFNGEYGQNYYIIDDSGYSVDGSKKRLIYSTSKTNSITLDENDLTSGTFDKGTIRFNIKSDYLNGDSGLAIAIPIGGGAFFRESSMDGLVKIGRASMSNCSIACVSDMAYGLYIDVLAAEACTMIFAVPIIMWFGYIGLMYQEGIGAYLGGLSDKNLYFVCRDSNTKITLGQSVSYISNTNIIVIISQGYKDINRQTFLPPLLGIGSRLACYNSYGSTLWGGEINELSPDCMIYNAISLSTLNTFNLNVFNTTDVMDQPTNGFPPKRIFVHVANNGAAALKIGIKAAAITLGYSINGATDNVLTVDGTQFGRKFLVTIILVGKVFYVKAEALTYVGDNVDNYIPSGGTTGQFLVKSSNTDYDVAWATVPAASGVSF